jgi:glutaredoxin 3
MAKIVMYKTPVCPYCVRAKSLFNSKGVVSDVEEIDISSNPELMSEMLEKTGGARSVPQIFINDEHIGGCDDLYALEENGQLDEKLNG